MYQLLESRGNKGLNAQQLSTVASDSRKTTGFSSKEREEPLGSRRGGERTEFVLKDFVPCVECWVDVSVLGRRLLVVTALSWWGCSVAHALPGSILFLEWMMLEVVLSCETIKVKTSSNNSSVVGRKDASTSVLEGMVLKFPTHA